MQLVITKNKFFFLDAVGYCEEQNIFFKPHFSRDEKNPDILPDSVSCKNVYAVLDIENTVGGHRKHQQQNN